MIDAACPLLPAPATGNNEFNWSGLIHSFKCELSQFLVQCLICQPLQEWSSSLSHGLLPQNLMVSSQCIRSPTTALEY